MSAGDAPVVAGAGMTPWGKWGRNFVEYGVEAAREALADAGIEWRDVQFVAGGETVRNGYAGYVAGASIAQALGWSGAQVSTSYGACASGAQAIDVARARILAHAGQTTEARRLLAQVPQDSPVRAEVFAALGDRDAAFTSLFRALDRRDSWLLFIKSYPIFERLHDDRRWDTVLAVLHGGVNRAILSYALTGQRMFLGHFEQAPGCVNVLDVGDEWIVRAVNVAPVDLLHASSRLTTMEGYWAELEPFRDRLELE